VLGVRRRAGVAGDRRVLLARVQRLEPLERREARAHVLAVGGDLPRSDGDPVLRRELEQLAVRHREGRMLSGMVKPTL
jgi:hypothetical protein